MIYLLLCILSSSVIFITFKVAGRLRINSFSAIIVNYLVACLAGFFLAGGEVSLLKGLSSSNILFIVLLGALYIGSFNLMGASAKFAGVAITSVAAKMSVIIPILFSVWIDPTDTLSVEKLVGVLIALISVFLITYRKGDRKINGFAMFLPLFIFLLAGVIDSATKYAQFSFVTNELNPVFNLVTFGVAGIIGVLVLPFDSTAKTHLRKPAAWLLGTVLGLANFGSIYFMIKALNSVSSSGENMQGSIIFGINSVGIVLICVLVGLIFKERPSRLNWIGFGLSVLAIFILAYFN